MIEIPLIRLEIERMKYQVIHTLSAHHNEIEDAVEKEIDLAIKNYPFEQEIEKLTREVLTSSIRDALEYFFKYGKGKEILKEQISKSLDNLYE